jgi:RHS repeat-associated protein
LAANAPSPTPAPKTYKFEGKERDTETGNDDFGARYYSNRFGRWLSVDWSVVPVPVPYANLTNPQTLNLYSMVADDPESFADLDGHLVDPFLWPQCKAGVDNACTDTPNDHEQQQNKVVQPLNLCAQTAGCTQTTDKNGVTTVTVVTTDAGVTTNKDGSTTLTSTTTTQTYTFNQAGNFTGGQYQTEGTTTTIGANGQTMTQPVTGSGTLTVRNAMHQLGVGAVDMFQAGFADTRGTLARFPGIVAVDAKANPRKYFGAVGEIGLLFVPVAQEWEGLKMSLELHWAAAELTKALAGDE